MALLDKVKTFFRGFGMLFGFSSDDSSERSVETKVLSLDERVRDFAIKNGISGYEGVRVGRVSRRNLNFPDAVAYAERDGGFLQSAREAVVVRVATKGAYGSGYWQHCRDFALYFRLGGVNRVVFVDGCDFIDSQNRSLISRVQEGFDAHIANPSREWLLPFDDVVSYVSRLDGRVPSVLLSGHFYVDGTDLGDNADARNVWCDVQVERGRVFAAPDEKLVLPTKKPKEGVYFGNHPIVKGLLGEEVARVYSDYLKKKGHSEGRVWFSDRGVISSIPEGSVLCRPVGLDFNICINAYSQFNYIWYARGLVHAQTEVSK